MQLLNLLTSLLSEKFLIQCSRKQSGKNQSFYQRNPKKSLQQIKDFYKGTEWEEYINQFNSSSELSYCVSNNIEEIPKCPYCGKNRKFNGAPAYIQTCGDRKCHQTAVADTCWEKYGCKSSAQNPEVKKKNEQTCLEHWGVKHAAQNLEIKEKTKQYFLDTYGVTGPEKIPGTKEKKRASWEKNRERNIKKAKEAIYKKYGVENISQIPSSHYKKSRRYEYEGINFDSKPELVYYIWCKEHGVEINRRPRFIEYFDSNNERHRFFPDFKVNGEIVEIKGDFLLDENGDLIPHPTDLKSKTFEEVEKYKDILKHKSICMKENNVKVLKGSEVLRDYEPYVVEKYGSDYLQKFRKNLYHLAD